MRTTILGKEGSQPFKITAEGVSRRHACITISDAGDWTLEDLNSSNGTFVRDETDGELTRVAKVSITPMTFISLGPDNAKGCCFYARQALSENYGNFTREYEYMNEKEEAFDQQEKALEQRIKVLRIAGPVAVVIFVFAITGIPAFESLLGSNALLIRIAFSSLSGIIPVLYDGSAKKKAIVQMRERFHHCPNPLCSNKLKTSEIKNLRCSKCKK